MEKLKLWTQQIPPLSQKEKENYGILISLFFPNCELLFFQFWSSPYFVTNWQEKR
jgi:hypothetical protein